MDDYFGAKAMLLHARARATRVGQRRRQPGGSASSSARPCRSRPCPATGATADWSVADIELSPSGATFRVQGPGVDVAAACPIPGGFNVANTLAAVAAAATAGYDAAAVAAAIADGPGVPGRLERIDEGQDFVVVVDYAHKPDAVAAALATLRPLTQGRLIVVLGAGGDRDPGKRPEMGRLAADGADLLARHRRQPAERGAGRHPRGDPRRHEPEAAPRSSRSATGASAIAEAVRRARPGDVVLIAGKGHESGQEVAERDASVRRPGRRA